MAARTRTTRPATATPATVPPRPGSRAAKREAAEAAARVTENAKPARVRRSAPEVVRPSGAGRSVTGEPTPKGRARKPRPETDAEKIARLEAEIASRPARSANGAGRNERKREIATGLVLAIAEYAEANNLSESERQSVANLIHHFPLDREMWPAELPIPDRSNWR
jgi:hypothetical protein